MRLLTANYSKPKKFPPESCDQCTSKEFEIFTQSWTPLVYKAMYKKWERQFKQELGLMRIIQPNYIIYGPIFTHHIQDPSQRHLKELALFKEFKGKPDQEPWVPDWTQIVWAK